MMTRLARLLAGEVEMCSGFFAEEICFLFTCLVCAVVVVVATSACWDMRQLNIGVFLSGKFLTYADDKWELLGKDHMFRQNLCIKTCCTCTCISTWLLCKTIASAWNRVWRVPAICHVCRSETCWLSPGVWRASMTWTVFCLQEFKIRVRYSHRIRFSPKTDEVLATTNAVTPACLATSSASWLAYSEMQ